MSLQFRRGLDADRTSITPLPGEPLWITDTSALYVGDGSTAGGVQITGGAGAPTNATYITQTSNGTLTNEQALASLATGILKNTTTTGVLSIAVGSDLPSHTHTLADITDDGTMAAQNASSVAITGGSLAGVTVTTGTYSSNVNEAVLQPARKETSGTITKGQVVRITNSSGTHLQVELADASDESTATATLGVAATDITSSTTGYIVVAGELTGLSNVPMSSFTNGDALWLSETAGEFTKTRPTQPAHGVFLGWVVNASNGSAGRIYVKVINGQELNELHDVLISGVADNHFLVYDNATSLWKNESPSTARTSLGLGTAATSNTGDFAAASHTHGNITNAGAIGTTSGLPVKTGTSGVLEAGAFGTSAGQFAEGNHTHSGSDITSGSVAIANGGTGQTTKTAAFDALSPATTKGDIIAYDGTDNIRLAVGGTNGHVLTVDSTTATGLKWAAASGGGSGGTKTYGVFTPLLNQPPASNFATLDTRNSVALLDFDASTDESAIFVGVMPEAAVLTSGLKIYIQWIADATTGTCRWGAQLERSTGNQMDTDSFDTAQTAGTATNGTKFTTNETVITLTNIDSVAAGELYRLKIYRDADGTSGTDDLTVDAELVAVEVRSAA